MKLDSLLPEMIDNLDHTVADLLRGIDTAEPTAQEVDGLLKILKASLLLWQGQNELLARGRQPENAWLYQRLPQINHRLGAVIDRLQNKLDPPNVVRFPGPDKRNRA